MGEQLTSFAVGDGVAAVSGGTWLLFRPSVETADISSVWRAVDEGLPVSEVLDALSQGTLGHVPDFVLVRLEETRVRVFARGRMRAQVNEELISGAEVSTWVEVVIDAPTSVALFSDVLPEDAGHYMLRSGVVPAAWLACDLVADLQPRWVTLVPTEETAAPEPAEVAWQGESADDSLEVEAEVGYDRLFGDTQYLTIEDAAVRPSDPDTEVEVELDAAPEASVVVDPSSTVYFEDLEEVAIPDATGGESVGDSAVAGLATAGSDDTIRRPYQREQSQPPVVTGGVPTVPARACPAGHLNPPHADQCRVCRAHIVSEDVIRAARPPLGVLVLPDGRQFVLDRTIIFGRAPSSTTRGAQVPGLVPVPGPDVSRSHVEVRIEDWSVLVVDLNSANGTTVALPERPPVRLRAHDPMLIVPGATICLADEVTITYEAR